MRGRKPVPTHLKIIRGNPGKQAINKSEPKPSDREPIMPEVLQGEALVEWHRISVSGKRGTSCGQSMGLVC
jgi:hypothetical protein